MVVLVILSSRSADVFINKIAPALFAAFPSMKELSKASPEDLFPYVHGITNFRHKSEWLVSIARILGDDSNVPETMEELVKLPGIGRKSANVIISQSGGKPEGVIVDLHVARVAPRIGIARGNAPDKIEAELMRFIPQKYWTEAGMGMTILGREVCRPKNPHCRECVVSSVCGYYRKNGGEGRKVRRLRGKEVNRLRGK
ncbi:MAG TPA: endonuclease III [Candidatus Kryptonia bacterium]